MTKEEIEEKLNQIAEITAKIDALEEKKERLTTASYQCTDIIDGDMAEFVEMWNRTLEGVDDGIEYEGGKEKEYLDAVSGTLYQDIGAYTDMLNSVMNDIDDEIIRIQNEIEELEAERSSIGLFD